MVPIGTIKQLPQKNLYKRKIALMRASPASTVTIKTDRKERRQDGRTHQAEVQVQEYNIPDCTTNYILEVMDPLMGSPMWRSWGLGGGGGGERVDITRRNL